MSYLQKSSSGFLYKEEDFENPSLLWDISPNIQERISFNNGSLCISPGEKRMELLISAPENNYVIQSQIEYSPNTETEKAGMMFKSNDDNTIELEIKGDNNFYYNYAKLIVNTKVLKAKSSINGTIWYDHGNTRLNNMNNVGFYIGDNTNSTSMIIKDFTIYKDNRIYINDIPSGNYIKIFNAAGNEITDKFKIKKQGTQIRIDGTNILYPISKLKIQVLDKSTDKVVDEDILENVYGGDVYNCICNVEFSINGKILDKSIYDLGIAENNKVYVLNITNKDNIDLVNRTLSIQYYSIYNNGYKIVKISETDDNYNNSIKINIAAGETKSYNLKIEKTPDMYNLDDKYFFNIILE